MTKKVSDCAQVAKLLKQKGKELGLTLSAKSISYAGRNSVTVDVLTGIDKAIKDLKDYSEQFEYSKWNGVYELNNYNENIPQTCYVFVKDKRAYTILQGLNNEVWNCTFYINDKDYGWYGFVNKLKKVYDKNEWQEVLQSLVKEQGKVPFDGRGFLFKIYNPPKEEVV